jgi:hypothetical protein
MRGSGEPEPEPERRDQEHHNDGPEDHGCKCRVEPVELTLAQLNEIGARHLPGSSEWWWTKSERMPSARTST